MEMEHAAQPQADLLGIRRIGGRRHAATQRCAERARIAERASKLGIRQAIVTAAADAGLIAALLEYFAAR